MKATIYHGDSEHVLPLLPDASVHSIVTDPPAGIGFMGKAWDRDKGGRDHWIAWMQDIAAECLRVALPGAHALVWALPRTSHWTATAWENAGWEVRDRVSHLFGGGFPKSLDVSKAIDKAAGAEREVVGTKGGRAAYAKQDFRGGRLHAASGRRNDTMFNEITAPATPEAAAWEGWGTALKPACEDWWLLRKPFPGTVAANVLQHGTGALNIDACRVPISSDDREAWIDRLGRCGDAYQNGTFWGIEGASVPPHEAGRWPANVVHDGSEEVLQAFPDAPGQQAEISTRAPSTKTKNAYGKMRREGEASADRRYTDRGGTNFAPLPGMRRDDTGSAARFFYAAKASSSERGEGNDHPTVKPLALMEWLVRLVTPPGGVVLDPFGGSGSTAVAALHLGFDAVLIEQEGAHVETSRRRIVDAAPLLYQVEVIPYHEAA